MVEQTYRVDMIPNGVPLVVHVSQYDTEARTLIFELYKGDVAYEVPAGAVASIAGTKPDKTAFIYPMAIDGNVVSIDLKQQMAIVAGDVLAEIQITDSAGKIGSANFVIRVERGPIDENSVISETDIPIFEQLVSDAQTAANEAQTAAEDAADAAESVGSIVPASTGTAGQVLTKKATGADWENLQWGGITGALTDQTDLASALDAKADKTMLAPVESTSTASQNYAVGDYLVYNGILYRVTAAISAGQTLTPGTNISATNAGAELTALNSGLAWRRILNVDTTANTNYDQTITTENLGNANEIMLTIQRKSNLRTFASNVIPFGQFSGGALYASGSYTLFCGAMNANTYRWINAVAIFVSYTQIEIAVQPNDEALTVRIFVR